MLSLDSIYLPRGIKQSVCVKIGQDIVWNVTKFHVLGFCKNGHYRSLIHALNNILVSYMVKNSSYNECDSD